MVMVFELTSDEIRLTLGGLDRWLGGRKRIQIGRDEIADAWPVFRKNLEPDVEHRRWWRLRLPARSGVGRRRMGRMLGKRLIDSQFWAVPAGDPDDTLIVLDVDGHSVGRYILWLDTDLDDAVHFADLFRPVDLHMPENALKYTDWS